MQVTNLLKALKRYFSITKLKIESIYFTMLNKCKCGAPGVADCTFKAGNVLSISSPICGTCLQQIASVAMKHKNAFDAHVRQE